MMDIDNSRVPSNCGTCGNYDRETGEFTGACGVCRVMSGGASVPSAYKAKPMTNGDRIRAMSNEKLAKFVASKIVDLENYKMAEQGHTPTATQLSVLGATMYDTLMMWLKQPAEG